MMKINSVFLSILLVLLIMEEVLARVLGKYSCYANRYGVNECFKVREGEINTIIPCWQNERFDLVKLASTTDCITVIFIRKRKTFNLQKSITNSVLVEDDTKLVLSGEFNTSSSAEAEDYCKNQVPVIKKKVLEGALATKVKHYNCTHCREDRCNENEVGLKEKEKRKFRCYETYMDSCNKIISDENAGKNDRELAALEYAFMTCVGAAEIKQKGECEQCGSVTFTADNNEKFLLATCGSDLCWNGTISGEGHRMKSEMCITCKYDLCNDVEKQRLRQNEADRNQDASNDPQKRKLTRNEARNQVVSNPTIIITFISLLVCLML